MENPQRPFAEAYYNLKQIMSIKTVRRTIVGALTVIAALALVGTVLFRYWINALPVQSPEKRKTAAGLVDDQPLLTAHRLSALAVTPEEQEFAKTALRLADHEVDMAFAAAMHRATEHAPPVPAAARPLLANVQSAQERVKTEQQEIARLKQLLAKADDNAKPGLEDKIGLKEATLEVDQEDLDALCQELIRVGGDPRSKIQQLKEQHEALDHEQTGVTPADAGSKAAPAPQEGQSRILMVQLRGWSQQAAKEKALTEAREELKPRLADLGREHKTLDQETKEESPTEPEPDQAEAKPAAAHDHGTSSAAMYSALKHEAGERKHLAELDKRSSD